MGDEGYFDWGESMERRQQESERQVQALLQETRRLREENDVLRIQVSSSGPSCDQRLSGQGTNSRHNQEATYLGNVKPSPNLRDVRPNEVSLVAYHAPQDESSDSTRVLSKRQRDKRLQLSDGMRARLGPQTPGKDRLHIATARKAYLGPSVVPNTQGYPTHQPLRRVGEVGQMRSP